MIPAIVPAPCLVAAGRLHSFLAHRVWLCATPGHSSLFATADDAHCAIGTGQALLLARRLRGNGGHRTGEETTVLIAGIAGGIILTLALLAFGRVLLPLLAALPTIVAAVAALH